MKLAPLLLCALALLAGCSAVSVNADYDSATDFAALRTWSWHSQELPAGLDELTNRRIRAALEPALASRGLVAAAAGAKADVLVAYHVEVRQRVESDPVTYGMGYGWRGGYAGVATGGQVRTYDEGTLHVDLVAPDGKTLLWRGSGTRVLAEKASPKEREERIREAVTKILEQFPPER